MPLFQYRASDKYGRISEGVLSSSTREEVIEELQRLGFFPIRVEVKGESTSIGRTSMKDIITFTQGLSNLLQAGIPLDEGLLLMRDMVSEKMRELVGDLRRSVRKGNSLASALQMYPEVFSSLYVSMVRAGEECGALPQILERLVALLEREEKTRANLKASLVYPTFVLMLSGGALIMLLTFVVPRFTTIFYDIGQELPVSLLFLFRLNKLIRSYWWVVCLFIILIIILLRSFIRSCAGRLILDKLKLKIPLVGHLIHLIILERLLRLMATMTDSGIALVVALDMARHSTGNQVFFQGLGQVCEGIREGGSLSQHFKASGLFPASAIYLIGIGEETGDMPQIFKKLSDIYEAELEAKIKTFLSLFEPAVILVTAVVVLCIVASILLPILRMNEILL